ncbi:DEAD/DEAH box helicase family protein [Chitinophaga sp. CC14]|uniref:DEAD/DEAH box helicase family protein n=1 Tax=Chitinophaga sp. CC14 TaxID=3029199 RepID=UPI003B7880D2
MAYNTLEKLNDNIAAIRLALDSEKWPHFTDSDIEALSRYSGFGGIKVIYYGDGDKDSWLQRGATPKDLTLYESTMELYALLKGYYKEDQYREVIESLRRSQLTAFYTPSVVPKALYEAMYEHDLVPTTIFEPSAGAGVFVEQAIKVFGSNLQKIAATEKDTLTARVLKARVSKLPESIQAYNLPLEMFGRTNSNWDLVVSNIPFGNFKVFDPSYDNKLITSKIHNYFFAQALKSVKNGGLIAFITTTGVLNSPSNRSVRKHILDQADLISVAVMPDNLMKETGNAESPSHLIILQKNEGKKHLNEDDKILLETQVMTNEFGKYNINSYLANNPHLCMGDDIRAGKNQYGTPQQQVWQNGPIDNLYTPLKELLSKDLAERVNLHEFFSRVPKNAAEENLAAEISEERKIEYHFSFQPPPQVKQSAAIVQMGIFDQEPAAAINQASAYITEKDKEKIDPRSAKVIATIRTENRPDHDSIVLITAKTGTKKYLYKLYSNVTEVNVAHPWLDGSLLRPHLEELSKKLARYQYRYSYSGDPSLEDIFHFQDKPPAIITRLKPFYQQGTLVVHGKHTGILQRIDKNNDRAAFEPLFTKPSDHLFFSRYTRLRDQYYVLFEEESTTNQANDGLREKLNEYYKEFTTAYGQLNNKNNLSLLLQDKAHGSLMLSSLERRQEDKFVPSDILAASIHEVKKTFITTDAAEALAYTLNEIGRLDIAEIGNACSKNPEQTIEALGDLIYLNPVSNKWETADNYLSGNVVEKMEAARLAAQAHPDNTQYDRSRKAIEKVQPTKIPFDGLTINFGTRWFPKELYDRFATEFFDEKASIIYLPSVDSFNVDVSRDSGKVSKEYMVNPKQGHKVYGDQLMLHGLQNTTPNFTYEVPGPNNTKQRRPDNEAIQLAAQKIESIRAAFTDWLILLGEEDKKAIAETYNRRHNCYVLRKYDGSHLKFPGLNFENLGITDLYSSQKEGVWMVLENRGGNIDHETGLGKTLTLIVAAHELKRLQVVRKPCIVAKNSNISQIIDTYRKAYPNDRILAPSQTDFSVKKRERLFQEIKNNDWDCIILTQEQFLAIPQDPEMERAILQDQLDCVCADMAVLLVETKSRMTKQLQKGLSIRQSNLEANILSTIHRLKQRKDSDITYLNSGIDHLLIDESHGYKNLGYTTRHDRVAGLGNVEGSQKALNMLIAIRTNQKRYDSDYNATFLSGTPLSNSIVEAFNILTYLTPRELEKLGMKNFDAWAAVFAQKTVDYEFSVAGSIIAKERFRHFVNIPELGMIYNRFTSYKTAEHIGLDKPKLVTELVALPPTPEQEIYIPLLMKFAETGNGKIIGRRPLTQKEQKGKMLIVTNLAKKMAVDMRLIDPAYSDDPGNKVNVCAANIARIYHETTEFKGTQVFFSDIGTPKPGEFNVYDAIKEKLVDIHKIPAHEISFVHDWNDTNKKELFDKFNAGQIRVLGGSTEKLGVGTNIQERGVAEHDIDIPWRPADLEQRAARLARQKNQVAKRYRDNKVIRYIYATERSLDGYKFNLLETKSSFIRQFKNSNLSSRTLDEGAMDENGNISYIECMSILSGDTSLLDKAKLDNKITVLESLRTLHLREVSDAQWQMEVLKSKQHNNTQILSKLATDKALFTGNLRLEKDGSKANPISLYGFGGTDAEQIGEFILKTKEAISCSKESPQVQEKIGTLYGFDLYARATWFMGTVRKDLYAINPASGIIYLHNNGVPNDDNLKMAGRYFLYALTKIDNVISFHQKEELQLSEDIATYTRISNKTFEKETELQTLKAEREQIIKKIDNASINIKDEAHKEAGAKVIDMGADEIDQTGIIALKQQNRPRLMEQATGNTMHK